MIKHLQLEQKNISGKFYFDYITYQIGMETLQNLNKALDLVVESEFSQAALDFRSIMIDNLIDADSISDKALHSSIHINICSTIIDKNI